jgi:CDP-glucose 4,6-dehydratase
MFSGRRVLVTGHAGFVGRWLSLWLCRIGAKVTGLDIVPGEPGGEDSTHAVGMRPVVGDVRDQRTVREVVQECRPEIVFHLAAQSVVRRSYTEPVSTWCTNVSGTVNLLDACRVVPGVQAVVVVTSDKVYRNRESLRGYRETDQLGGHDPYSASKAAAELVAGSYRAAFFEALTSPCVATVRAGNIIGGGDWGQDRIVPDIARSVLTPHRLEIRSPLATRPWQYVLDALHGYLLLGQALLNGRRQLADAWNFGPDEDESHTVLELVTRMHRCWPAFSWSCSDAEGPHETTSLRLDSSKARRVLGWRPTYRWEETVELTAAWYRQYVESGSVISLKQLDEYLTATARRHAGMCH